MSFVRRLETSKLGSDINEATAFFQLFQCANEKLGDLILKYDPVIMMKPVEDVLANMEFTAVIKVALHVRRTELIKISQGHD